MTTQHTPASWINDGNTISAQVDPAHPSYIAPVCFLDDDWAPEIVAANARLIAAAPDLLNMLRDAENWFREYDVQNSPDSGAQLLLTDIRAAIAKATGETA